MTTVSQHPRAVVPRGWRAPHVSVHAVIIIGLVLAFLMLAISAASQAFAPQITPAMVVLNDSDAGRQVVLNPNQSLEVSLSGNPTSGYQWLLDPASAAILKPAGEPVYRPDSALVGAGGTYTWRFTAIAVGQAPLQFVYRRIWEQDTPPLRTFAVTVVVK
jgi:inhibitor of cysteine peptidase